MNREPSYYLELVDFNPFADPEIELVVPLSKPQEEIWLSCFLGGEDANRGYNESVSLQLKGWVDQHALHLALQNLILRHQSLRSTFKVDGTEILIHQHYPLNLNFSDLSHTNTIDQKALIESFLQQEAFQAYDLENGPLFRTTLFKLSEQEYYFTFSAHHIICDGWSLGILLQDLSKFYSAFHQGLQLELPEVPQMSQYITEQLQFAETSTYAQTREFWVDQFRQEIPVLKLPVDFKRSSTRTYKSMREDFSLNPQLTSAIKKTGTKQGCSFVVSLLCAFEVLLHKVTGQQEIILGLPTSGQAASGYDGLTGHCVNLLPIKSLLNEKTTFNAYLRQRKPEILDALDHQQISLGNLLKALHFSRDNSRIPLVPVVFNMDLNMDDGVAFEGLSHRLFYNPRAYETFEIFLNAIGSEQELTLEWSYNTQLFRSETIRWLMESFETLMQIITKEPDLPINDIRLPSKKYLSNQMKKWNDTQASYPQEPLSALISQNLEKHALKTAIRFHDSSITNGELLSKSNQLAAFLIGKGMKQGDLIALALDRSIEMVIALIAVLKSGAAYIPLDPTYPHERIHYMLQDSGAKLLLTNQKYKGQFLSDTEELIIEEVLSELGSYPTKNPDRKIIGSDLAYVLYTSGSTGKPKGVQIEHHNLVNFFCSIQKWPGISADDKMLAISTISFDIAGLEIFLPLVSGAEIILADSRTAKNGQELLKLIKSANVSLIQATPATFRLLLGSGWNDKIPARIFCCGEAMPTDLAKKLPDLCNGLWNMYGPTETTIYSTGKQIYNDESITIGHPIANTQIYILDEMLNAVPEHDVGEIFIGGDGVARGYFNRPELTAARFPENKFSGVSGKKMYRTGDVGRFLENGEIEYLGRADYQVKIRGHRVELGEIEAQLGKLEQVDQTVVTAREDQPGNQKLVAYVIAPGIDKNDENQWIITWKSALKEVLPPFMIPAQIVFLKEFPLTPNNKIDRKALPKPEILATDLVTTGFIGPRTDIEKLVSDIWCEVLEIPAISMDDNFFEIGGHSITAIQIMSRIEKESGKHIPLTSLFESSTIESLALLLQLQEQTNQLDSIIPIKPTGNKTPVYMIPGSDSSVLIFSSIAFHMDGDQPVFGLQSKEHDDSGKPLTSIEEIAAYYITHVLKHHPSGPYAIAGYSFGGYVAIEMARQLDMMGKDVKMLAMFDTNTEEDAAKKSMIGKVSDKIMRQFKKGVWITTSLFERPKDTISYQLGYLTKKFKSVAVTLGVSDKKVADGGYLQEMERSIQQNDTAHKNYKIKPFNGRIDLFRAKNRIYFVNDFKYLGWKKYALKGVKIYPVPGDHKTMLQSPNDKFFAKALQKCLDQPA